MLLVNLRNRIVSGITNKVARQDLTPVFPRSVKIDPFLFDDQRPLQHLGMDRADIFADDADEDQLNGGKEKEADGRIVEV
jgi:hypothetical protein